MNNKKQNNIADFNKKTANLIGGLTPKELDIISGVREHPEAVNFVRRILLSYARTADTAGKGSDKGE